MSEKNLWEELVGNHKAKKPFESFDKLESELASYVAKIQNVIDEKKPSIWEELIKEQSSKTFPAKVPYQENPYQNLVFEKKDLPKIAELASTEAKSIDYLFNEGKYIEEAKNHIDKTYGGHYSGQYQATSIIIDAGHGTGFNIGNIIKYAKRYGKKDGYNKADLMKIIHYAIMQMHVHDTEKLS